MTWSFGILYFHKLLVNEMKATILTGHGGIVWTSPSFQHEQLSRPPDWGPLRMRAKDAILFPK
jgi:hypothetical protein